MCASAFEAEIRELRLIQRLQPRFNRAGKNTRATAYLKLTNERFPRLTVARRPAGTADDIGDPAELGAPSETIQSGTNV